MRISNNLVEVSCFSGDGFYFICKLKIKTDTNNTFFFSTLHQERSKSFNISADSPISDGVDFLESGFVDIFINIAVNCLGKYSNFKFTIFGFKPAISIIKCLNPNNNHQQLIDIQTAVDVIFCPVNFFGNNRIIQNFI